MTESLLDAVLLQDKLSLFLLPILMFAAIITRTFVQGFGVLFAIFICVFVLPTPFVRPPGPLDPGIRDELLTPACTGWPRRPPGWRRSRSSPSDSGWCTGAGAWRRRAC